MKLRDGDLLLLQDCQEPLRPLTPAEQLSVELVTTANKESFYDYNHTFNNNNGGLGGIF